MSRDDELPETMTALATTFGVADESSVRGDRLTLDDVRRFVSANVERLLDKNPALLMSILYRIDVSEPKVRRVLETEPPTVIVDRLTELIIERQLQKARLRRRYDQKQDS